MTNFYAYRRAAGSGPFVESFGLDFEDFVPGQRFLHRPGLTLSQQDNVEESLDTQNAAMIHYDAHYAAQTVWKLPLMVSSITLQRLIGMTSKTFGRRKAVLGFKEIALTKPLFGGDTIYAESEILACEPHGDDSGVVTALIRGVNPQRAEVARLTCQFEVFRRGRGPGAEDGPPVAEARFAAFHEGPDSALVEQTGLFFESFTTGDTFIHYPSRSFHWEEAVKYAGLSMDLSPRFHDVEWIARHQDGKLQIPETFVITVATTLTTRTFGRVVANLGWYDVKLPRPVLAGDTIRSESTIQQAKDSRSRPNEGILTVETRSYNQRRELVVSYVRNLLVYRRTADNPYAAAGY